MSIEKKQFIGEYRNGQLACGQAIQSWLCEHVSEGRELLIEISENTKKRSNPQSKYRWAVVIDMIRKRMLELGNDNITPDELNDYLKRRSGIYIKTAFLPGGTAITMVTATKDYSPKVFEEFMDWCRAFASEYLDIDIPLPVNPDYDKWVNERIEVFDSKHGNEQPKGV